MDKGAYFKGFKINACYDVRELLEYQSLCVDKIMEIGAELGIKVRREDLVQLLRKLAGNEITPRQYYKALGLGGARMGAMSVGDRAKVRSPAIANPPQPLMGDN